MTKVAILDSISAWRTASRADQNAAAAEVAKLLPSFTLEGLQTFEGAGEAIAVATFRTDGLDLPFVLVPGGEYRRDPALGGLLNEHNDGFGDIARWDDDRAHRLVTPVRPFLISRWPVTETEWSGGSSRRPVVVSWQAAQDWAVRHGFKLPSEVEWEWACRGGSTSRYFWGDAPDDRFLWHSGNAGETQSVDAHLASSNQFGLVDPLGGVWEWCEDAYRVHYLSDSAAENHSEAERWEFRIIRGGSVESLAEHCTSATWHFAAEEDDRAIVGGPIGFRVAAALPRVYRPAEEHAVGEQIMHPKFGRGVVRSARGKVVEIEFGDGTRKLAQRS